MFSPRVVYQPIKNVEEHVEGSSYPYVYNAFQTAVVRDVESVPLSVSHCNSTVDSPVRTVASGTNAYLKVKGTAVAVTDTHIHTHYSPYGSMQ